MSIHSSSHPLAGWTVVLVLQDPPFPSTLEPDFRTLEGASFVVTDWWDRVVSETWDIASAPINVHANPVAIKYARRRASTGLPNDNQVVYGTVNGTAYAVHTTELTGAAAKPPSPPTVVTAVAGVTNAAVTFSGAVANGSAITGYKVTATDSDTPSNGGQTATGASSPITVPGLTTADHYTFTVQAINAIGTGPASIASNAVVPT